MTLVIEGRQSTGARARRRGSGAGRAGHVAARSPALDRRPPALSNVPRIAGVAGLVLALAAVVTWATAPATTGPRSPGSRGRGSRRSCALVPSSRARHAPPVRVGAGGGTGLGRRQGRCAPTDGRRGSRRHGRRSPADRAGPGDGRERWRHLAETDDRGPSDRRGRVCSGAAARARRPPTVAPQAGVSVGTEGQGSRGAVVVTPVSRWLLGRLTVAGDDAYVYVATSVLADRGRSGGSIIKAERRLATCSGCPLPPGRRRRAPPRRRQRDRGRVPAVSYRRSTRDTGARGGPRTS